MFFLEINLHVVKCTNLERTISMSFDKGAHTSVAQTLREIYRAFPSRQKNSLSVKALPHQRATLLLALTTVDIITNI